MSLIEAIIIAIVEGLTEFLPISSTGHMIITSALLGIENNDFTKLFFARWRRKQAVDIQEDHAACEHGNGHDQFAFEHFIDHIVEQEAQQQGWQHAHDQFGVKGPVAHLHELFAVQAHMTLQLNRSSR